MPARIYVACLASYNNGTLYGKWIDARTDVAEMAAEIADMLRGSPYPNVTVPDYEAAARAAGWAEEAGGTWRHITDNKTGTAAPRLLDRVESAEDACKMDGLQPVMAPSAEEWAIHDYEGLGPDLGEYAGLQEVAKRVAIAEVAEDRDIPVSVLIEAMSDSGEDDAESFVDDKYRGKFDSWQDMAEQWIDDTGELYQIPEHLRSYFDYAAYGRDMDLCGDFSGYRLDGDLYVFWNH